MMKSDEGIKLIELSALPQNDSISIEYNGIRLLVIHADGQLHVIEDRCGHFGVSLKNGHVANGQIRCPTHGARFDLSSGELCNDLFEQCDPINVYLWRKKDGWLEVLM